MHEEKTDVCFVKITLAALPISLPTIKLFEAHTHTHTFRLFNIDGSRISQGLQIAVPESGGHILESFKNVHLYKNVDENWFIQTFAKLSHIKAPALQAG